MDTVQVNNGNLMLRIPLDNTPGRGLSVGHFLIYNSKGYYMSELCSGSTCNYMVKAAKNNQLLPAIITSPGGGLTSRLYQTSCDGGVTNIFITSGFSVVEPDGTSHHMVPDPQGSWGCQIPLNTTRYAEDGSGWVLQPGNSGKIFRKDGATINVDQTNNGTVITAADTNGNQLTLLSPATDTLGRSIPSPNGYYDSNGKLRSPAITYVGITASTNLCFTPTPPSVCSEDGTAMGNAPSQIALPNGLSYSFQYSGTNLVSMTLPTGAVITYTYTKFLGDYSGPRVASRTVTVNGQSATWTYTYAEPSPDVFTTTVLDPYNNQTVYTCIPMGGGPPSPGTVPGFGSCQITDVNYYSGTSTLLKTVHTDYWSGIAPLPKAVTTTTYSAISGDSSVTKLRIETDYDGQTLTYPGETDQFTRGDVLEQREFTYDSAGNNPQLVRKTDYSYLHQSDSRYEALNIANRVTDKVVYDCTGGQCTAPGTVGPFGTPYSGGTRIAETQNSFDSTPLLNANGSPTAVSVPGHDDTNFGTANTLRGNVTQTRVWMNVSNSWLTSTKNYDVLGNLISATDPGNHTSTFNYADDWNGWSANTACLPPSGSYAFLTDSTNAKGQHTHNAYFPCTGQVQSSKDQNDINNGRSGTIYTYDPMKRLLSKSLTDGGSTSFSYSDSHSDLSATETTKINSILNRVFKTSYDELGREKQTALLSDPDGVTYKDTTYDLMGRKATLSNPYRSTSDATYGITSYAYDALGRNTTVIPPDGSVYFNNSAVAFGGNYTITTDQTGNQRKRYIDPLGRVTEVDEPGVASTGGAHAGGTFTISSPFGGDQSHQQGGAYATGTVQVGGTVRLVKKCVGTQCNFITDSGTLSIAVDGAGSSSAGYAGTSDTAVTISNQLVSGFSANAYISASASGTGPVTITLSAHSPGPNYTFTTSQTWDRTDFTSPQIAIGPSSGSISGGIYPSFSYDAGQVSITIAGYTATTNYDQNSTTDSIATAFCNVLNSDIKSPVTAVCSGSVVNVTSKAMGGQADYTLSANSITTQFSFSSPSFVATPSGASMTGGANPSNGLATPFVTLYSYDMLNNLTRVEQHGGTTDSTQWRVRTFQYDSLSHLTQSNNPETGTINFTYDAEGKLASKSSPAPNQTGSATVTVNYSYDELHRHTVRSYSNDDPAISYIYDAAEGTVVNGLTIHNGIGRQTSTTDASGSSAWTYDSEGRVSTENKTIGTVNKGVSYGYNLDGSLASIVYPSGNTVTYTPAQSGANSAGRIGMIQDTANNIDYVTGINGSGTYATYAPDGSIASFTNGYAAGFPGIGNTFTYNTRLQPGTIQAGTSSATVFSIGYDFHITNGDNGNVYQLINYKDNNRSQMFTYDQLNRLISGKTSASSAWGTNYTIDSWGNITGKTPMAGMVSGENFSQAALSNNRLTGFSYDAAGNTTSDGINSYVYNAENQIISAAGVTYTYDGNGDRVKKSSGMLYWYGAPGIVAESDLNGNLSAEYIFFGGERIARRDLPSGAVHYYFSDHLKSTSVVTSSRGGIEEESDYRPWGEENVITHALTDQHYKFNGKERDSETGFDEFGARLYSSAWSRWLSPDWSADPTPVPYGQMDNPQSLNLYVYALNNPTTLPDLDGHLTPLGGGGSNANGPEAQDTPEQEQEQQQLAEQTKGAAQGEAQKTSVPWAIPALDGIPKEIGNEITGLLNLGNNIAFLFSSQPSGVSSFPESQPNSPGEKAAMTVTSAALLFVPLGEAGKAGKIEKLTAEAEKAYPKKAGLEELHHIIPKYLGGAKDGETIKLPAAYHQYITNEFRRLAEYGAKIERTAEEVGRILQQVYSKYPLP